MTGNSSWFATGRFYSFFLRSCILVFVLCVSCKRVHAADNDEIMEFLGDQYVIHVDRMQPDGEMTLMDVLNTCPEFLSINGKTIDQDYILCIDNMVAAVDYDMFLNNVRACEIDHILIYSNTSVSTTVDGARGMIDVYYRDDVKTDGKVTLTGNTYGNGMVYADVTNRTEKFSVQAYAMGRASYGKANPIDLHQMTNKGLVENLHLKLNWKMSDCDNLIVKAFQSFGENKSKLFTPDLTGVFNTYNRDVSFVLSYSHTFKNEGFLIAETGGEYDNATLDNISTHVFYPYAFLELQTPVFTPDLWLLAGVEVDYDNTRYVDLNRGQLLITDLYAKFDYSHGPWLFTLGDRFSMMNYWDRLYSSDHPGLWKHSRCNHSYVASAGFKAGRHFFQGLFARRFYIPVVNDFLFYDEGADYSLKHDANRYSTNLAHQAAIRYSYQKKNFVLHTSIEGTWFSRMVVFNYQLLGIKNSVYWKIGPWELTLGANYYYQHANSSEYVEAETDNYVTLKLAPVLHLPHGFRLSSTLLYCSRRNIYEMHPHLFAAVKANKQFGKKFNVFAEFNDLAGYTKGYWIQLSDLYQNRAVSVGVTFYPFRK